MSIQPKPPSPAIFYQPSSPARLPSAPVLLTPSLSPACDFSTPPWAWGLLAACIFLLAGKA